MITYYYRNLRDKHLQTPATPKAGTWVHVVDPLPEEIAHLVEKFSLEEGLVRDALDMHEVPRLEVEDDITYFYTRVPVDDADRVVTAPILFALTSNAVITIMPKEVAIFDTFVREKVEFYTTQRLKLFLLLFAQVNRAYSRHMNNISRRVRSLRVRLERISNKDIAQFVNFEEVLNDFLSALMPTNTALGKLLNGRSLKLYEDDIDLVEDLLLSNGQLMETARANLKTIVNVRNAYATIMSMELNRVMRILTSLTILLTIPTMVFSFYGMNVAVPYDGSPQAWLGIIGGTLGVSALLLFVFMRNRWL